MKKSLPLLLIVVAGGCFEYRARERYLTHRLNAGDAAVEANDEFVNIIMRGALTLLSLIAPAVMIAVSVFNGWLYFALTLSVSLVCVNVFLSIKWSRRAFHAARETRMRLAPSRPHIEVVRTPQHLVGN